jgi:hypothetical protein
MRKWVPALFILVAALVLWFSFSKNKAAPPVPAPDNAAAQASALSNALATQNPATIALIHSNFASVQTPGTLPSATSRIATAPAGRPAPLQFTNFSPSIVMENMRRDFHKYNQMYGGNPVGINSEITSQLSGNNPKHINFLNPDEGMRVNDNGELVDPWGTPYFFHQLSGTDMQIRSAGPDKIMWTDDDLVTD